MNIADEPFRFVTAAHLTRIHNLKAESLQELRAALEQASDASIFFHTFQSLEQHHFLTQGFSNDFAQWVHAALNRPVLAEQLAGLDIRDYVSLADLRGDLRRLVADYCEAHPREADVSAFEPFYFCESEEVTVASGLEAATLDEFAGGLRQVSHASFAFHFLSSRLRLQLKSNDFSQWLAHSLGLEGLARKINRIDIYTNTLDTAREAMLALLDAEAAR